MKSTGLRIVIILGAIAAAGFAGYYAITGKDEPPEVRIPGHPTTEDLPYINVTLKNQGVPAPSEPEWDVQVQLNKVGQQHRFTFKVTEKHGWAANGVYLAFWHQSKDPDTGEWKKDSRETQVLCSNDYLHFGQPLEYSTTVAVYEVPEIKDFGASENWAAKVASYSDLTARPKP